MREHPIPQDITNYRFHIVGSMTLKQFAEIFLGVIIAVIFYSTNLPSPIKWMFIVLSVALGAGSAFIPIEERPLDHWIITFFRVLYKPTKYFWTRKPSIPEPFLFKPRTNQEPFEPEFDLTPAKKQRIKEYLTSVNTPSEYQTDLTNWEADRIQQIVGIFSSSPKSATTSNKPVKPVSKPNLNVRVRSLRGNAFKVNKTDPEVTIYQQELEMTEENNSLPVVDLSTVTESDNTLYPKQSIIQQPKPQSDQAINVPKTEYISLADQSQSKQDEVSISQTENQLPKPDYAYIENKQRQTENVATRDAAFNSDLPFPDPLTEPNKIVGMVLSPNNELITNAIVEIKTEKGQIVRAVKTNALGQFFITTPLNSGTYVASVEKEGYNFEPQKIILTGEVVAPLEVKSI